MTRNPEIGNTPIWDLPNIWRLKRESNTKFSTNFANKMLLNAAKCQGYNFYHFWVIKEKPTGGKTTIPLPTQIKVCYVIFNIVHERVKESTKFTAELKEEIFSHTEQKMFPVKYFFSKCDQICRKLRIRSQLLNESLMENSIFVQCQLLRYSGILQTF